MKHLGKHLGLASSLLLLASLAAGCTRADPKETQMAGEASRPNQTAPATTDTAEPPISAPGAKAPATERIPMPGDAITGMGTGTAAAPAGKDSSFSVALEVPANVASGAEAIASVKVTPGAGYKVNEEYPTKLTLQPTDGVTTAKAVLLKGDAAKFDQHELAFNVKLTPTKAGTYTVNGTLAFAVCTEATCDPKTEKIAINLVAR
jgi:hypothetical protein